jgi:hypothetical protein
MKLALIVDNCRQESFQINEGKSYKLGTDIPYQFPHSINNECHIGFWSYPKLFGDGYFIKIDQTPLPDLNLDIIIAALQLDNWQDNLSRIRNKYKNAIVLGTIKELNQTRIDFLNSCDKIAMPFLTTNSNEFITWLGNPTADVFCLAQPIDVDYLYNNFFCETKKIQLFQYNNNVHARRGYTAEFCNYISDKYNIPIVTANTTGDNINQWRDFILSWRESLFHINLDPYCYSVQQTCQCAALGVVNFGGCNDPFYSLFPSTATNDFSILEQQISKCLNEESYLIKMISSAWEKVNALYSIKSVKNELIKNLTK